MKFMKCLFASMFIIFNSQRKRTNNENSNKKFIKKTILEENEKVSEEHEEMD